MDYSQGRCYIQFDTNENEAVKDRIQREQDRVCLWLFKVLLCTLVSNIHSMKKCKNPKIHCNHAILTTLKLLCFDTVNVQLV